MPKRYRLALKFAPVSEMIKCLRILNFAGDFFLVVARLVILFYPTFRTVATSQKVVALRSARLTNPTLGQLHGDFEVIRLQITPINRVMCVVRPLS